MSASTNEKSEVTDVMMLMQDTKNTDACNCSMQKPRLRLKVINTPTDSGQTKCQQFQPEQSTWNSNKYCHSLQKWFVPSSPRADLQHKKMQETKPYFHGVHMGGQNQCKPPSPIADLQHNKLQETMPLYDGGMEWHEPSGDVFCKEPRHLWYSKLGKWIWFLWMGLWLG